MQPFLCLQHVLHIVQMVFCKCFNGVMKNVNGSIRVVMGLCKSFNGNVRVVMGMCISFNGSVKVVMMLGKCLMGLFVSDQIKKLLINPVVS